MAPGRAVESNVQQLRTATRFSPERQKFSAYQLGERRCIAANTARLPAVKAIMTTGKAATG